VCHRLVRRYDPFSQLQVEIKKCSRVEEALDQFTAIEKLVGDEKYRCKTCKRQVEAEKKFMLFNLPPVLVIQLKRFDYTSLYGSKISDHVMFEEEHRNETDKPKPNVDSSRNFDHPCPTPAPAIALPLTPCPLLFTPYP